MATKKSSKRLMKLVERMIALGVESFEVQRNDKGEYQGVIIKQKADAGK